MRGKRLSAHRQYLRELAKRDAARRCARCKVALPAVGWAEHWGDDRKWCSVECMVADLTAIGREA